MKSQTSFLTVQDGLYSLSRHSRATKLCYWGLRVFSQDKAWYTVLRGSYYFANSATTPSRPRPRRRTSGPRTYIPCGINYIIRVILVIGKVISKVKSRGRAPARVRRSAGHNRCVCEKRHLRTSTAYRALYAYTHYPLWESHRISTSQARALPEPF